MSTNHTPNYALSLWEASDQVQRTEFNENHAKIDAALAGLQAGQLRLITGSYKGTGMQTNTIELPFRPKFFFLQRGINEESRLTIFGNKTILVCQHSGAPTSMFNGQGSIITIEDDYICLKGLDGLSAHDQMTYAMNSSGADYYYLAIG